MSEKLDVEERKSYWKDIFEQSRVNGGVYFGEHLPRWPRRWPQNTWLQRRLRAKTVGKDEANSR